MKDHPVRLTTGQTIFIFICLCMTWFFDFYLGARFGPEFFWNIKVDRLNQDSLLPGEIPESELKALLDDQGQVDMTFHEELQKKTPMALEITEDLAVKKDPVKVVTEKKDVPKKEPVKKEKPAEKKVSPTIKGESDSIQKQIEHELVW